MRRYYRDPGTLPATAPPRPTGRKTRVARTQALCPCCARGRLSLLYAAYPGARVASLRCFSCGCEWGLNPSFRGHRLRIGAGCNGRRT